MLVSVRISADDVEGFHRGEEVQSISATSGRHAISHVSVTYEMLYCFLR